MKEYMMTQDVARILGKSPETVRFYERTGKLPAIKTVGGRRLFREVDVLRFAETRPAKEAAGDRQPAGKGNKTNPSWSCNSDD